MAIEFTRLADVTAIEEVKDEDTVLVVQDGEVKRAPKTAVGGSGGILTITFIFTGDDYNPQIIGGTFEDLANAFENNMPFMMIHMSVYDGAYICDVPRTIHYNVYDFQIDGGHNGYMVWNSDGTFNYPD